MAVTIAGSAAERGVKATAAAEAESAASPRAAGGLSEPDAAAGSRDGSVDPFAAEAIPAPKEVGESKQRLSTTQRRQQALAKSSRLSTVEPTAPPTEVHEEV